jgi:hypothetical protein
MFIVCYIIFAVICAVISYGMLNATLQDQCGSKPNRQDKGQLTMFAFCVLTLPPLVVVIYLVTGFAEHGLKFD